MIPTRSAFTVTTATVVGATCCTGALLIALYRWHSSFNSLFSTDKENGSERLPRSNRGRRVHASRSEDSVAHNEKEDEDDELGTTSHVYRIVLTGGPCAGKTTALARLSGFLQERGFRVFTVPEVATMLFVNGASLADFGRDESTIMAFQKAVLDGQMALENGFARVAASVRSPAVLLCDRGALDGSAYMSRKLWCELLESRQRVLIKRQPNDRKQRALSQLIHAKGQELARREDSEKLGHSSIPDMLERALCERYDAVFHLVTAAAGAERFYSLENNAARSEPVEGAREADIKTQRAWAPHPRHIVFDNSAGQLGFEGKLQRVVEATAKLVGLPVLPKSTRKFVVASEPPDDSVFIHHGVKLTSFYVTKTFLARPPMADMSDDETYSHSYVRLRLQSDGSTSYGLATVNVEPATGVRIERKRRCTPREYFAHVSNADPGRVPVRQRRLHFLYDNQSFVVHQYLDRACSILHCQAARVDGTIKFPPFLQIGQEITKDHRYSAYHLSQSEAQTADVTRQGSTRCASRTETSPDSIAHKVGSIPPTALHDAQPR